MRTDVFEARDCSPFPSPSPDEQWLRLLSREDVAGLVIRLAGSSPARSEAPVVRTDSAGRWWTGRYIGSITFEGIELRIVPRFGFAVLEEWLSELLNVATVPVRGEHTSSDAFLVRVLAAVWGAAFVEAARHGLPALRQLRTFEGTTVRGQIDVPRTQDRFSRGVPALVSRARQRGLDNPISRTIVLAHEALRLPLLRLGVPEPAWLPPRGRDLLPAMRSACGSRPLLPDMRLLTRIRYTPITQSYRPFVRLSHQIARRRGWLTSPQGSRRTFGALIDIAELWELFVVRCAQRAAASLHLHAKHGSRQGPGWAVATNANHAALANVVPDVLMSDGNGIRGVLDAKYKSLRATRQRPRGFQQADLYQLIAYMERFGVDGALVYPQSGPLARPVTAGPWRMESGRSITFIALPTGRSEAREALGAYLRGVETSTR